ncbi:MAG: hypothetical protein P8Y70_15825 [Candidatus Lokiarchaeota archaeon]
MNSINQSKERKYCYDVIDSQLEAISSSSDQNEVQKKKFQILSKLVSDLFKYRDSTKCIKTISNLIITTLISFEETHDVDCYSENGSSFNELDNNFKREGKHILLKELFKSNDHLLN